MFVFILKDITKDTTITAVNGKEVSAMKVFSLSLMFFREHALQELTDQSSVPLTNQDIRWVITVPAIWRESAKQFMRQAAYVVSTCMCYSIAPSYFPPSKLAEFDVHVYHEALWIRNLRFRV